MRPAFGFDTAAIAHPGSIVDKGEGTAQLLRWGALSAAAAWRGGTAPRA